jgi:hypothetical protein
MQIESPETERPLARRQTILLTLSGAVTIAAYVFYFCRYGFLAGFTHDDLMNGYRALTQPLGGILLDNLTFFRHSLQNNRPLGGLLYRVVFDAFGFHPFPLHVATVLLLFLDIGVMYVFSRELTGSARIAAVAALIQSYHGRFSWLVYNSGTCYDTLCFLMYFTAFAYYLRIRRLGRILSLKQTLVWMFLFVLALDAKEMAVSLPPLIGLYELLFHPPKSWRVPALGRWLAAEGRIALAGAAINILFLLGRVRGGVIEIGAYVPEYTADVFFARTKSFLDDAVYGASWFTPAAAWTLIAVALLLAWRLRFKSLWICLALMGIGILPLAFIAQRGLDAAYIPAAGLAIFVAVLFVKACDRILRIPWLQVPEGSWVRVIAPFVLALALFGRVNYKYARPDSHLVLAEGRYIGAIADQIKQRFPVMAPHSRILFLHDPFKTFHFSTIFLIRDLYRDETIDVDRLDFMQPPPTADKIAAYDHVLSFENGRIVEIPRGAEIRIEDYVKP